MNKILYLLIVLVCTGVSLADDGSYILLQSTTSTKNSGLYDYLLPKFKEKTDIEVRVVAVGTGQALKNAMNGDADVLIVHARDREEAFVRDGYGLQRHELMYNDFVIVGPAQDPANVLQTDKVVNALANIAASESVFLSRGDDSGTHIKELSLWKLSGIEVNARKDDWYREAGTGMGATLNTAVGMNAYTLSDRATWISFGNKQDHVIVFEQDPPLNNQYGIIAVNPAMHPHVKIDQANQFIEWMLSDEGQRAIASYRVQGEQLFFPNAR